MSSGIIFFIFIPIVAIALLGINYIFAPHNPYKEKNGVFECGFTSFLGQNRTQFSISFFIFALLFLLFDLEILLVYPYLVSSYVNESYGLSILLIFLFALILGFAFELGKKALTIETRQTLQLLFDFTFKPLTRLCAINIAIYLPLLVEYCIYKANCSVRNKPVRFIILLLLLVIMVMIVFIHPDFRELNMLGNSGGPFGGSNWPNGPNGPGGPNGPNGPNKPSGLLEDGGDDNGRKRRRTNYYSVPKGTNASQILQGPGHNGRLPDPPNDDQYGLDTANFLTEQEIQDLARDQKIVKRNYNRTYWSFPRVLAIFWDNVDTYTFADPEKPDHALKRAQLEERLDQLEERKMKHLRENHPSYFEKDLLKSANKPKTNKEVSYKVVYPDND